MSICSVELGTDGLACKNLQTAALALEYIYKHRSPSIGNTNKTLFTITNGYSASQVRWFATTSGR